MKKRISKKTSLLIIGMILIFSIFGGTIAYAVKEGKECKLVSENGYNRSFYGLVNYIQNVETYLAKALVSKGKEHGIENLTNIWREASIAQSHLSQLPIKSNELENTAKFLNQISDYSYALSRKNISGEDLNEEDLKKLDELHQYSLDLENTLNQLADDLNEGRIKWKDLKNDNISKFATEVSNITKDSFSTLEENFHEYAGLIYDGAFSDHITSIEKKGLIGDDVDEQQAKNIAIKFYGKDKIENIKSYGLSENADIPSFDFQVKLKNNKEQAIISITKKGGHVIFANYNKEINSENIKDEDAEKIAREFLEEKGYKQMKQTYYYKQNGIITINYAYVEKNEVQEIIVYPDLIKVKVGLDDGSILGIETKGYLNSHYKRDIHKEIISKEKAKEKINKEVKIKNERLAIIPTKWKTEELCWEFRGKLKDNDFLIYINAETGKEQDILLLINTVDGTLTH